VPRPPRFDPSIAAIPGAIFSPREGRLDTECPALCPLHVGDTWMEPFPGARMEDLREADFPGLHRYTEVQGIRELVDAVVEKVRTRNGIECDADSVLATSGATGGLCNAVGSVLSPGEEVLILAPFWPLIRGIVRTFRGVPVEVPFYDRVDSPESAVEAVAERLTPATSALYVSTPSNPTGRVIPRRQLEALAEFARREGLWLLSDEVYEDYVYRGEHVSLAQLAPERTISVFSFSKAYGMAGNRTGYLVGPAEAIAQAKKVATHTSYHPPTSGQVAGLRALRDGGPWLAKARALYREAGEAAARQLGLPEPEGSTFLFLDVSRALDDRGLPGFLGDCLEAGVALAPGRSCGDAYDEWVRICYTAAPPDEVAEAVGRLAQLLR
jgi:N-succinyldiaminopimelate aminotransferase